MIIIREHKLEEKFEPASEQQFVLLKKQMDTEPELQRMLATPIGEIDQYKWLTDDSTAREFGLFDILETLFHKVRSNPLLLSKAGNKFTGFIFYKEIGKSITGVKMASFYDDTRKPNHILAADLMNFIKQELPRHDKIIWRASRANIKAIRQYNAFLEKEKFVYDILPEPDYIKKYGNEENIKSPKRNMLVYRVTGKKP